ncbi:hypothetical protein QC764_001550 [Podospora pseudoanserina]|uniref:C3H1-type domain-containing protein n=1 Tax=Podospora pseudoanserina TaxID=2609844 RepID=A0ABR0I4R7_9PEZI|nr:hypothetical protein QC764_001550 [Podospora pseudoanserina]
MPPRRSLYQTRFEKSKSVATNKPRQNDTTTSWYSNSIRHPETIGIMTVCKFFQQGNCRFGNNCRFEHPRDGGSSQSPFGGGGNRFSALSGGQQGAFGGSKQSDQPEYAGLNEETIRKDLQNELPQWIFSCYGPGKDAPDNLFGGYPREQQPEELRIHFMKGQAAGEAEAAMNEIMQLHQVARQQIEHTLSNVPAAIQHVRDGINRHPNRHDICKQGTAGNTGTTFGQPASNAFQSSQPASNPFGATAQPAAGGFGQPAALGQKPNPFGAPAFGQPAQPAATPSPFGQPAAPSAFGQPASLGASNPFGKPASSGFGQPSALGGGNKVFGQAAAPAFGQSGFGQTTQAPSAFGQPAALGATPSPFAAATAAANTAQQNPSPFGQPAQNPSPFGAPAPPAANGFRQPAATPSPFGAPAAAPASNPFGAASQPAQNTPSPFGQPAAPAANPFGQPAPAAAAPSPFGAPAAPTATPSPFGAPAATTAAPSAFGQPVTAPAPSPFGGTTATAPQPTPQQGVGPYGPGATRSHPPLSSYASKNPDNTLGMFKGRPVMYEVVKSQGEKPIPVIRGFDGSIQKIWNPNGAPNYTAETEAEPEKYNDPTVQRQWMMFVETGRFENGIMPEVPPKREFCVWDF